VVKADHAENCFSGAKQAAEKGMDLIRNPGIIPQGLKPVLIMRQLRHD
jgi:hypothetical protein